MQVQELHKLKSQQAIVQAQTLEVVQTQTQTQKVKEYVQSNGKKLETGNHSRTQSTNGVHKSKH
jgi:hypothetical protein